MKRGIIKDYLCCLELIYTEPKHSCVVIYDENHNIFLDENCIFYTVDNNANIIRHRVKKEKDLGVLDDCNEFYSYYSLYKKIDCYYNIKDAEKEKNRMSNYNNERTLSNKWFKEHNINLPDNVKIIYTDFKVKEEEPEEYEIDIDEFNSLLSGYYLFDDGLKIELIDIEKTIIDALTIKKEVNFDIGNVYDKSKILRNYVTFKIKNK